MAVRVKENEESVDRSREQGVSRRTEQSILSNAAISSKLRPEKCPLA